jgi:hypothetical protein
MRKTWGSRVDPLLESGSVPYNTRALIDACRPYERLSTFPRVAEASPKLMRETASRWKDLFADPRFPLPETAIPPEQAADSPQAGDNGAQPTAPTPATTAMDGPV